MTEYRVKKKSSRGDMMWLARGNRELRWTFNSSAAIRWRRKRTAEKHASLVSGIVDIS